VSGFTHSPNVSELVALGRDKNIPVLHDLGSGCLLDTAQFGLAHEPMPQESIAAGVSLALFSGDKLLGGPQAGVIAGKAALVELAARHPMARAVRIDKLSIAALSATLIHYIKEEAVEKVPVWRMIAESAKHLEERARRWSAAIGDGSSVVGGLSTVGGGSLPGETLSTWLVALDCTGRPGGAEGLAGRMRHGHPPVVGRIEEERVLLDPRTVLPEQEAVLLEAVRDALSGGE
jgi:L-seryl-tRNA(Ser) seleniumtransferase